MALLGHVLTLPKVRGWVSTNNQHAPGKEGKVTINTQTSKVHCEKSRPGRGKKELGPSSTEMATVFQREDLRWRGRGRADGRIAGLGAEAG